MFVVVVVVVVIIVIVVIVFFQGHTSSFTHLRLEILHSLYHDGQFPDVHPQDLHGNEEIKTTIGVSSLTFRPEMTREHVYYKSFTD